MCIKKDPQSVVSETISITTKYELLGGGENTIQVNVQRNIHDNAKGEYKKEGRQVVLANKVNQTTKHDVVGAKYRTLKSKKVSPIRHM